MCVVSCLVRREFRNFLFVLKRPSRASRSGRVFSRVSVRFRTGAQLYQAPDVCLLALNRKVIRSSSRRSSAFLAILESNQAPRDLCQVHPAGSPLCHNTHWCLPRAPSSRFSDFLASADRRSPTVKILLDQREKVCFSFGFQIKTDRFDLIYQLNVLEIAARGSSCRQYVCMKRCKINNLHQRAQNIHELMCSGNVLLSQEKCNKLSSHSHT